MLKRKVGTRLSYEVSLSFVGLVLGKCDTYTYEYTESTNSSVRPQMKFIVNRNPTLIGHLFI